MDYNNEFKLLKVNAEKLRYLIEKKIKGEQLTAQEDLDYSNLLYYFQHS